MKLAEVKDSLNYPDRSNRSALFWSWNGKLEREELYRQIEDFAGKGVGGFLMHAREGLEVPYLSEQWMQLVSDCAGKGKERGLLPYIYDDDKWPSGMAGGKVASSDPDLRATAIVLTYEKEGCYAYGARIEGKQLKSLHFGERLPDEQPLYIDVQQSGGSDWYSGSAPANNLDYTSVQKFLEITHEKYRQLFDDKLSDYIEGFFTDEPNFTDFFASFDPGCPWLPWTKGFDEYFMERRGYSIVPCLPWLFYEGEQAPKVRHDYWRTLTELFNSTYFRQIYDWCEANGVKSMGHLLFENGLCSQARVCGAAMPHYQYMHVPGVDILGERTQEYLTVKQCTSVARQMGRRSISETYGCTGWQLGFEGQKWLWDWLAVQGISIRSQHLAQYSIKGLRKRDYPPVFNYQATWWEYEHVIEDYCARLSVCAEAGAAERPVLVLHPQSSVWLRCGCSPEEDLTHLDNNMGWTDSHIMDLNAEYDRISRLAQSLLKNQCDFDFGDELLMEEHAFVQGMQLQVAKVLYDVVVVPDVETVFSSTLELLRQFKDAGGKILWLKKLPGMVNGQRSDDVIQVFPEADIVGNEQELLQALEPYRRVRISDIMTNRAAPILTSLRKMEDGYLLLAVNNDRDRGYRCYVELPFVGSVECFDLLTGEYTSVDTDEFMGFYADFASKDAKVYLLHTFRKPNVAYLQPVYHDVHESPEVLACLGPTARFSRTELNTLPLDRCCFEVSGVKSDEMALWQAQKSIRESAGFRSIHANGMPMRYTWIGEQHSVFPVRLFFSFTVDDVITAPMYIALEERESMTISCNGMLCDKEEGWFKDRSIRLVRLEGVCRGKNLLLLEVNYSHELELEDIYICGSFAVDAQNHIIAEPKVLRFGDWCLQGYPYYAGSMIYHFEFQSQEEKARLRLGEVKGALAVARINGGNPIYIPWKSANDPAVVLNKGDNILELEIVGTNRNLFGPLHQPYQLCSRIDWRDFRTEGGMTSEECILEPYGIFEQCYLLKIG